MVKYYLFSGFNGELGFPNEIARKLQKDVIERKKLVFIASQVDNHARTDFCVARASRWFQQIEIHFHSIVVLDHRMTKEMAASHMKDASCIYLLNDDTLQQQAFLSEYQLEHWIKKFQKVVIGVSAGAMNMVTESVCIPDGFELKTIEFDGLGLVDVTISPHFQFYNLWMIKELKPTSIRRNVYGLCNQSAIVATKDGIQLFGDVYIIRGGKMKQVTWASGKHWMVHFINLYKRITYLFSQRRS